MTKAGIVSSLIGLAVCISWAAIAGVKAVQFGQNCTGYLKLAADANTVPQARAQLAKAVEYLEHRKLTEGFTSVLWNTPDEDIGFWYTNLRESLDALSNVENSAPLEQSNALMKLRETILDQGADGSVVTRPMGISRFPNNLAWGIMAWIGIGMLGIGVGMVIIDDCI